MCKFFQYLTDIFKSKKENIDVHENRITCLLGAGAAIEIGGPSSIGLTKEILSESEHLKELSLALDEYYGGNKYNFEDLLHLIETFLSYQYSNAIDKKYKPILGAFIRINFLTDYRKLIDDKRIVYQKIWEAISKYDSDIFTNLEKSWYLDFWRKMNENKLDIITLNYDNTIHNALAGSITDGFLKEDDTYARLNLDELYRKDLSKIINLHGSINFGHYNGTNSETANKHVFEDDFHELYKYLKPNMARDNFFNSTRSSNMTQYGEVAEITPIITGLKKADKLLVSPYNAYHNYFYESIRNNSSLLIVGYSFGDLHINNMIEKITALHGDNRKIVVITYLTEEQRKNWHPDHSIMMEDDGWLTTEALFFYSKAAKDYYPLGQSFTYQSPIISKNGNLRVYLEGFNQAARNHGDEIIEFLTSK
ncbi:SIR2 family protein [Psychrobacillus sp. L4]|uniref:SIR2 family protein n=1 Tax=Psychrobacillus sp. L4 TaxID=3236892 RepID=UPI0036F3DAE2